MPLIDAAGAKTHIAQMNQGAEEAVILIHGLFTNLSVFYFAIAPRLARRFRVVMYDLRGHGMSEWRDGGYGLAALAGDLLGLMDALGIRKAGLAGYSYGGLVALSAALSCPERVGALALIDSPRISQRELDGVAAALGDAAAAEAAVEGHLRALGVLGAGMRGAGLGSRGARGARQGGSFAGGAGDALGGRAARQAAESLVRLYGGGRLRDDMQADMGFLDEAQLGLLGRPALLLYGRRSPNIGAGRDLARRIPGALLKVGRGDHNLPVQSGAWVGRQLLRFYAAAGAGSGAGARN
ncbi:MAG: alpha/beta hydrolase [Clostridiales bacterium]|jgi:pimeloyl-ACP methyl ester carboxylesterase|nr:alpha/beta hydrolase [Clostridiales bacterium]